MKPLLITLALLFITPPLFAQKVDVIHRQMWLVPLAVLFKSESREVLGIDTAELSRVSKTITAIPQQNLLNFGATLGSMRDMDLHLDAPWPKSQSWQTCQSKVYEALSLSPRQEEMHRAIVFQQMLSEGWVAHAMRYAGFRASLKQEADWQQQAKDLQQRLASKKDADDIALRLRVIENEIGKDELKKLIGKEFLFTGRIVDGRSSVFGDRFELCLQPLRLFLFENIREELAITKDQLKSVRDHEKVWLSRAGMRRIEDDDGFFDEDELPDYEIFTRTKRYSDSERKLLDQELLDAARSVFNDGQRKRYDELLLRSYIEANQLARAEKVLGVKELDRGVEAASHLRSFRMHYAIVANELTAGQKHAYLGFAYVPGGFLNKKPAEQLKFTQKYAGGLVRYVGGSSERSVE